MVRVFNCPNCHSQYDQGDRFCQDCGLPLCGPPSSGRQPFIGGVYTCLGEDDYGSFDGITGARPRNARAWESLSLANVPAEIVLVAAALAYIASALAWCNYPRLWDNARHLLAEIPHALAGAPPHGEHAAAPSPPAIKRTVATSMSKHEPAANKAQSKKAAGAAATAPGGTEVGQLFAQCEEKVKQPLPDKVKQPLPDKARQPVPGNVKPVVAPPNVAAVKPQPVNDAVPGVQKPARAAKPAVALQPSSPRAGKPKLPAEEVENLAQYNQMLADYFIRVQNNSQPVASAPSFKEWIAGGKQPF